jgi:hypothetical protein
MKFKAGDQVRLTQEAQKSGIFAPALYGRALAVTGVLNDGGWQGVNFENERNVDSEWLELAPPAPALIDASRTYRTRDGREARILCTDAPGDYPVIALVRGVSDPTQYSPVRRFADGSTWPPSGVTGKPFESGDDLIEVKPEITRWIVCDSTYGYDAQAEAREAADWNGAAVVSVTFRPGDGL